MELTLIAPPGRYALRNDQWERIWKLLPGQEGHRGVTAADNRLFVEAVLFRLRTGAPWRDLPERFGDWKNVHRRFSRWAKSGVWQRVFEHVAAVNARRLPRGRADQGLSLAARWTRVASIIGGSNGSPGWQRSFGTDLAICR